MVEQFQSRLARIGSKRPEKSFLSFKDNHAYLTDLQYSTWLLRKYSPLQHLSQSGRL